MSLEKTRLSQVNHENKKIMNKAQIHQIAVLIPTYNHIKYISGAIESARKQAPYVGEIIVIDDGSIDGTFEYLRETYGRVSQVTLIRLKENLGVHEAVRMGICRVTAGYFCILAADDLLMSNWGEQMGGLIAKYSSAGFFHADSFRLNEKTGKIYSWSIPISNTDGYVSPEEARRLIGKYGIYFPSNGVTYNRRFWSDKFLYPEAGPLADKFCLSTIATMYGFAYTNKKIALSREQPLAMNTALENPQYLLRLINDLEKSIVNDTIIENLPCFQSIIRRELYHSARCSLTSAVYDDKRMSVSKFIPLRTKLSLRVFGALTKILTLMMRANLVGFVPRSRVLAVDPDAEKMIRDYTNYVCQHTPSSMNSTP